MIDLHLEQIVTGNSLFCISGALAIHDPRTTSPQITYDKQGYIISHRDYPNDYPPDIDSTLIISGLQPQQFVRVKFLLFEIYPGCSYDFLRITGSGGWMFCGDRQYKPHIDAWYEFKATDSQLNFQFVTNRNQDSIDRGFYLQYKGQCAYCIYQVVQKTGINFRRAYVLYYSSNFHKTSHDIM